ncbi:MAG: phosphoglycolate phosphatase [Alphaproteobacteria bacterium]|nr:phosphoglycolate phosphatase [Alphaproteobacteria bacterium]
MQPWTLVFDLDGTLVDTAPDLCGAMNAVLALHDRAPVPIAEVRHMVGRGARVLMERGFAFTGAPAGGAQLDGLFEAFLAHYAAHIADESVPFPGARETLAALRAQGHGLGICTNKPERLSHALLDALDLGPFFGAVLGADTLPVRKPDPRHLLETIARLGGDPERAVMIGDSETDAETARAAGVPLVIFTFGYTALDPQTFGADALLHGYDELPAALDRIMASRGTAR